MKKLRYFLETALLKIVAWILPRLPRGLLMALSRGSARWPSTSTKDDAGRRRIAIGSYQTFVRTILDLFWSSKLTKDTWQPFFASPRPHIEERARQTGGVWVTPHFGNFELISMAWGCHGCSSGRGMPACSPT